MVGIVVPLLPTTVLVILAAYCFARSSERLHDWLISHRYFGVVIGLGLFDLAFVGCHCGTIS